MKRTNIIMFLLNGFGVMTLVVQFIYLSLITDISVMNDNHRIKLCTICIANENLFNVLFWRIFPCYPSWKINRNSFQEPIQPRFGTNMPTTLPTLSVFSKTSHKSRECQLHLTWENALIHWIKNIWFDDLKQKHKCDWMEWDSNENTLVSFNSLLMIMIQNYELTLQPDNTPIQRQQKFRMVLVLFGF